MKIGEVKKITGLSETTLRYYEETGLIQPTRAENQYREYSVKEVMKIIHLNKFLQLGLSTQQYKQLKGAEYADSDGIEKVIIESLEKNRKEEKMLQWKIRYQEQIVCEIEKAKKNAGKYFFEEIPAFRYVNLHHIIEAISAGASEKGDCSGWISTYFLIWCL